MSEPQYLPPAPPEPRRREPFRPAFPVPSRIPLAPPGVPPFVQPGAPVIETPPRDPDTFVG